MGKRGPRTQPTQLKVLRGNPGRRPLPEDEPKPVPIAPDPPAFLDREAKSIWRGIAPELERLGLLTVVDGPAFSMLVTHYIFAVKAARKMNREGILGTDEQGVTRKHPASQILRDHSAAFRQYCAEFGLTPSARTGLKTSSGGEADPFEEFLSRGRPSSG